MYQHPVPQNVTNYQFRLIGDMTIKQFAWLAGGLGLGAAIYFLTNLYTPIKFGLGLSSAILGTAIAFLPFEERSLDHWIKAYIKAIYRPTQYIWTKDSVKPAYFDYHQQEKTTQTTIDDITLHQLQKREGLSSYMQSLPDNAAVNNLDTYEVSQLTFITDLWDDKTPSTVDSSQLKVESKVIPQIETGHPQLPAAEAEQLQTSAELTIDTVIPENKPAPLSEEQKKQVAQVLFESNPVKANEDMQDTHSSTMATPTTTPSNTQATSAMTSTDLPFPSTPTTPNTIVGMVLDRQNQIIENALIEVRNSEGLPVRATKTNMLGQFFSTTPLKNGEYEIVVEKEGYAFTIITLNLTGKIVTPLEIHSKE